MRSTLTDIEVIRVHQTQKAILVKAEEDAEPVWIPFSRCQFEPTSGRIGTLTIEEDEAIERGLV